MRRHPIQTAIFCMDREWQTKVVAVKCGTMRDIRLQDKRDFGCHISLLVLAGLQSLHTLQKFCKSGCQGNGSIQPVLNFKLFGGACSRIILNINHPFSQVDPARFRLHNLHFSHSCIESGEKDECQIVVSFSLLDQEVSLSRRAKPILGRFRHSRKLDFLARVLVDQFLLEQPRKETFHRSKITLHGRLGQRLCPQSRQPIIKNRGRYCRRSCISREISQFFQRSVGPFAGMSGIQSPIRFAFQKSFPEIIHGSCHAAFADLAQLASSLDSGLKVGGFESEPLAGPVFLKGEPVGIASFVNTTCFLHGITVTLTCHSLQERSGAKWPVPPLRSNAPAVTRTRNLLIRSQMLYPIELRVLYFQWIGLARNLPKAGHYACPSEAGNQISLKFHKKTAASGD